MGSEAVFNPTPPFIVKPSLRRLSGFPKVDTTTTFFTVQKILTDKTFDLTIKRRALLGTLN